MKAFLFTLFLCVRLVLFAQLQDSEDSLVRNLVNSDTNTALTNLNIQPTQNLLPTSKEALTGPKNFELKNLKQKDDLQKRDSILRNASFIYDSIFRTSEASESNFTETRSQKADYVLPVMLLFILIYFTWLRFQFHKQIRENITILFNMNLAQQIFRDREFSMGIFRILILGNIIFIFGIYFYQLFQYYHIKLPFTGQFYNILFCLSLFPIVYFLKSVAYAVIQFVFNQKSAFHFFRFNTMIIYQLLSIVLLPCIILMVSVDEPLLRGVFYFSYVLIGVAFFIRIVKGILLLPQLTGFQISYFLMYICGLEIAPIMIVLKLLSVRNL